MGTSSEFTAISPLVQKSYCSQPLHFGPLCQGRVEKDCYKIEKFSRETCYQVRLTVDVGVDAGGLVMTDGGLGMPLARYWRSSAHRAGDAPPLTLLLRMPMSTARSSFHSGPLYFPERIEEHPCKVAKVMKLKFQGCEVRSPESEVRSPCF